MDKFKIATINARGLNNTKKRISLFQWIQDNDIDIVFIQETYCTKVFESKFKFHWDGDVYSSFTDSRHSRGTCILISKRLRRGIKVINIENDKEGRLIMLNVEYNDTLYTLVNMYCPSIVSDRVDFLTGTIDWVTEKRSKGSNLIIGGDMNCIDWPTDRASLATDKSSETYRNMKKTLNITDTWKLMHPDANDFTYIDPSFRNMNSRIDVICVSEELVDKVENSEHKLTPCPDHKAVVVSIRCTERKRGPGYWKLNTSILREENYVNIIRGVISDTISEYNNMTDIDKSMIWELIKIRVKEFSIQYCCDRGKRRENEIRFLESKIVMLDRDIQSKGADEKLIRERKKLKEKLDILFLDKGIGAQIRSKVTWVEEGERSSAYFLAVEKHRQGCNMIKTLTDNGKVYTEDTDILHVAQKFYSQLYTSESPSSDDIGNYLDDINLANLLPEKQDICEGSISQKECENAINSIKQNKSPGEDGLPIEFYRTFWKDIHTLLLEVYNECFDTEMLPLSMRKSIITLIHKKDEKNNISNYRPISLTNADYRIIGNGYSVAKCDMGYS
jgi:exonuclease III